MERPRDDSKATSDAAVAECVRLKVLWDDLKNEKRVIINPRSRNSGRQRTRTTRVIDEIKMGELNERIYQAKCIFCDTEEKKNELKSNFNETCI